MKKNNFDRKQVFILILSPILSLISFVLVYYLDPLNYGDHVSLAAIPAFLLSIIIICRYFLLFSEQQAKYSSKNPKIAEIKY